MAEDISNPLLSLVKEQGLIDDLQYEEVLGEHTVGDRVEEGAPNRRSAAGLGQGAVEQIRDSGGDQHHQTPEEPAASDQQGGRHGHQKAERGEVVRG